MKDITIEQLSLMLKSKGEDSELIRKKANSLTEKIFGRNIYLRGIIEFSNLCTKDCLYCGIRRSNKNLERYTIEKEEIKEIIKKSYIDGFRTVVLQSGEVPVYDRDLTEIIEYTKKNFDMAITLSVGERKRKVYYEWKRAGADRFLLRIETTNRKLFKRLHPDDDFDLRLKSLLTLKELGYETGTGVMIGLPGQTYEDLAKDILFFKLYDFDMLGVGPFIPHHQTPLKDEKVIDFETVLNFIALLRLVTINTNIPATTSMATLEKEGREKALNSGANVIMPNYTPQKYREKYLLYDNKICVKEDESSTLKITEEVVKRAGKKLVKERGDRREKLLTDIPIDL
ncbi:TPA: [FeFe] hydrogenase H-cluster radical SAM maturase HydE [candidate division WOR-3 bacterium]|nr:[FeFe] hydrogenase H-cluster radical SAM maturase HydE [candidate division WOR-3 bacterium]